MKKRCKKCGQTKDIEEFVKSKPCVDGFAGTCRACQSLYSKKWKRMNSARYAPRRRESYRLRHAEERVRVRKNKEEEEPFRERARRIRRGMQNSVKKRGIRFDKEFFTTVHLVQMLKDASFCPCCGTKFEISDFDIDHKNQRPTADRIDNTKGYIEGNVAIICWRCNSVKGDATLLEVRCVVNWMEGKS